MVGDVVWKDPPAPSTGPAAPSKFDPLIEELRGNPGVWGIVLENDNARNALARTSDLKKRYPDCDFTGRTIEGRGYVFGKANGR